MLPNDTEPEAEAEADQTLASILTPEPPAAEAASVEAPPAEEPIAEAAPEEPQAEESSAEPVAETAAKKSPSSKKSKAPAATDEPPKPDSKNWYIVKVQSNREDSIKEAIERRVKIEGLEEYFGQILIPVEKVSEMRNGKRVVRTRKKFPGYIMANVEFNDRILYLFRETSGVGDFVGASMNRPPLPMPAREVEVMLMGQLPGSQAREQIVEKIKVPFDKGDKVRVRDGTFAGMEGEVKEIMEPKDTKEAPRVRVELTIFGRPVPVEVEAWQVEQL